MLRSHPVLPFLVAAAVLPLVPRRLGAGVLLAAPVVALVQLLALDPGSTATVGFFGYELTPVRFDDLSRPFAYVFVAAAFAAALFGARTLSTGERVAASLTAGFGVGVVLAGDLLTLFAMWELKAVATAGLVALGGRASSGRAAYRYLIVHVVGGTLLLGGVLWHLGAGGSLAFDAFGDHGSATLVLLAFLLSAAVPPLHAWLPDAYPEASVAGMVFLSAFTTKAAVYALLRGFLGLEVLVVIGVAMALYGVVYAVLENDLRRLLGYHIVSQVGFMVTAVGIGTAAAANGATAHAFAHILYKALLLMAAGAVVHATGKRRLSDLGGLSRAMPVVFVLYLVGAVSISGAPLFSGFVSKELVVDAARQENREIVLHLLKLASVGTFLSVGLKLPWFAFGGADRGLQCRRVPVTMLLGMGGLAAANLVLGVWPGLLYGLMPYDVDYTPYTAYKLAEITQLLLFTGLAFWLLVRKLGGEPSITLDTDWVYRSTPRRIAAATSAWDARMATLRAVSVQRLDRLPRLPVVSRLGSGAGAGEPTPVRTPPVVSTAVLGTIALGALVLVLGVSLVS
jgi:multicomponent Na+:H+ antiporter subunit D